MKPEQERVSSLLAETVSMLCKNGLTYSDMKVQGLLGITLNNNDVFVVHINEHFGDGIVMGSVGGKQQDQSQRQSSSSSKRKKRKRRRTSDHDSLSSKGTVSKPVSSSHRQQSASDSDDSRSGAESGSDMDDADISVNVKKEPDDTDIVIVEPNTGHSAGQSTKAGGESAHKKQRYTIQSDNTGGEGTSSTSQPYATALVANQTATLSTDSLSQGASDTSWDGSNLGPLPMDQQIKLESSMWSQSGQGGASFLSQDTSVTEDATILGKKHFRQQLRMVENTISQLESPSLQSAQLDLERVLDNQPFVMEQQLSPCTINTHQTRQDGIQLGTQCAISTHPTLQDGIQLGTQCAMSTHQTGQDVVQLGTQCTISAHQTGEDGIYIGSPCKINPHQTLHNAGHSELSFNLSQTENTTCEHCGQAFKSSFNLKNHLALKHGVGVRYRCQVCSKGFMQPNSYSEHMDAHAGIKKQVCPVCNVAFSHRSGLRKHKCSVSSEPHGADIN